MKKLFFVLGAPDHEMREIERVVTAAGHACAYATVAGKVVHSYEAYRATGIDGLVPSGHEVVFVECAVMGLRRDHVVDHHRPGDPGYGCPPAQFLEGSSLGQVLALLGLTPTSEQLVIAAADHCLSAAYRGQCPGVSPQELQRWREQTRSTARGLPAEELRKQIDEAQQLLERAPRVKLADTEVAWVEDPPPEVSEASARSGVAYMFLRREHDGRMKAGIRSAPAPLVAHWLQHCGLRDLYGDPQRGFAGGYFD